MVNGGEERGWCCDGDDDGSNGDCDCGCHGDGGDDNNIGGLVMVVVVMVVVAGASTIPATRHSGKKWCTLHAFNIYLY